MDLVLESQCRRCGSTKDLFGSQCKHMTLCVSCAKPMALNPNNNNNKCYRCGSSVSRLIRSCTKCSIYEQDNLYNVRPCTSKDKNYFLGRFVNGLPSFSKKQKAENRWALQKEGLQGRQITTSLQEKYKNKPWLLEDETGQSQYQGQLEGQSATYYLLMQHGKDYVAIPSGSWYNFNKVAQYKQLTLEEAEEKMSKRRNTESGYGRWLMKGKNNGDEKSGTGGERGRKKTNGDEDEANASDKGEEDEDQETSRKNRLGLNKRCGDSGDEEELGGGDLDSDDDDVEKGDDWDHEEFFTDDDEALGNDSDGSEDLAPEIPPPEIKQDEDENSEEEGGLSNSGKELKKLLGRLNESDDDDDDDDDLEDEAALSPVLAPKEKDAVKEEPVDDSPAKLSSAFARGTPSNSKSSKIKRKSNGDNIKASNGAPSKKVKIENEVKTPKDETMPSTKHGGPAKATPSSSSRAPSASASVRVTEYEIQAVLQQNATVTTQDLVGRFKSRLRCKEDKDVFAAILRRISKIQKTNGANFVVLRDR